MKRGIALFIYVVICAFAFLKVVNASACSNATQAVYTSPGSCYPKLTTFGDRSLCNSSSQCGMIFRDVLNNCNSSEYLYTETLDGLDLICNAPPRCFNATINIQNDYFCDLARMNLSAAMPSLICNGSCRALLDDLVTDCGNNATGAGIQASLIAVCGIIPTSSISPTSSLASFSSASSSYSSAISTTSPSSANSSSSTSSGVSSSHATTPIPTVDPVACTNALGALSNNTVCDTALSGNLTDTAMATICQGTCRTLLNNILSTCGDTDFITTAAITEHCGPAGLGMGVAPKGMGFFVILLTAVLTILAY